MQWMSLSNFNNCTLICFCTEMARTAATHVSLSKFWDLTVTEKSGKNSEIPFYVKREYGSVLLGNEIHHRPYPLVLENVLVAAKSVRDWSSKRLTFKTYTEPTMSNHSDAFRTKLLFVRSETVFIRKFFSVEVSYAYLFRQEPIWMSYFD